MVTGLTAGDQIAAHFHALSTKECRDDLSFNQTLEIQAAMTRDVAPLDHVGFQAWRLRVQRNAFECIGDRSREESRHLLNVRVMSDFLRTQLALAFKLPEGALQEQQRTVSAAKVRLDGF